MRPNITSVVGIAAVLALTVWAAFEHQRRVGLTREHQALEQHLEEMAQLITSNQQLSDLLTKAKSQHSPTDAESRELLRLRGQVAVLRQQSHELDTVRQENRQARTTLDSSLKSQSAAPSKAAATADYWPQDSWSFKG